MTPNIRHKKNKSNNQWKGEFFLAFKKLIEKKINIAYTLHKVCFIGKAETHEKDVFCFGSQRLGWLFFDAKQ